LIPKTSVPSPLSIHPLKPRYQRNLTHSQIHNYIIDHGETVLILNEDDCNKDAYPDPEIIKKTSDYTLADIYDNDSYKGKTSLVYEYDHGDGWQHHINFLGREDPIARKIFPYLSNRVVPLCMGGEGHPAAEECGGKPSVVFDWLDNDQLINR
jgi:hypothetical protein